MWRSNQMRTCRAEWMETPMQHTPGYCLWMVEWFLWKGEGVFGEIKYIICLFHLLRWPLMNSPLTERVVETWNSFPEYCTTQVQFPVSRSVAFSCTVLPILFSMEPVSPQNEDLFSFHRTLACLGQGVTWQSSETSSPHMGTDGEADTVKGTKMKLIRLIYSISAYFRWICI